jgi:RNA polymerase sigma-70 factor, ECF subfamily
VCPHIDIPYYGKYKGLAAGMLTVETEAVLVARAQKGDRGAYGELVQRYQAGVVNVVYHMCSDAQLAQDAAQEAFIQAWLHLPSYRPQSSLRNWLYRIAVNAALDAIRHQKPQMPEEIESLELIDPHDNPEGVLVQRELALQVQKAVQALPDACRVVLLLREFEQLTYQDIASTLDIPIGTVMSRLNYARDRLRLLLRSHAGQSEVNHG